MPPLPYPVIVAVSDRRRLRAGAPSPAAAFAEWCRLLARAGVSVIYVREPDLEARAVVEVARAAVLAVAGTGCRVLVRDRADIALASGAHGVHLSAGGMPARRLRALLGPDALVGRSVHAAAEARRVALAGGCDYLLFGTVFASASKAAGHAVAGVDELQATARDAALPVVAIGGVDAGRASLLARHGASGLAGIALFAPAGDGGDDAWTARLAATTAAIREAFTAAGTGPRVGHGRV